MTSNLPLNTYGAMAEMAVMADTEAMVVMAEVVVAVGMVEMVVMAAMEIK